MKNKFILLFFALYWFICLNVSGANESPTEMRFDSLRTKAQEFINTSDEIYYLDSMLQLAQTKDSVYWECLAMSFMARNYYNRMIPDSLMYWADKVDELALKHKHYKIFFDTFSFYYFYVFPVFLVVSILFSVLLEVFYFILIIIRSQV